MKKRILIADSDENVIDEVKSMLHTEEHEVISTKNGREALEFILKENLDLIILEVNLEELDGFSVCKTLRVEGCKTPIIFLTRRTSEIDAVIGLDLGAQDYIRKPLQKREFLARVNGLLRKEQNEKSNRKINIVGLEIDLESRRVKYNGKQKELTNKEFQLLYILASCPNKVFSRFELLDRVWESVENLQTRTVDLHMGYLRKKIEEDPKRPRLFKTIRGAGYFLDTEE